MRVDPLMQLSEAIRSVLEAIAYPTALVLTMTLLVLGALELRSRLRRPKPDSKATGGATARGPRGRARSDRVAPAAR